MKIIIKNKTELLNMIYGDDEDYSFASDRDIDTIIDDKINYLESLRGLKGFIDTGDLGDIINMISQYKYIREYGENEES